MDFNVVLMATSADALREADPFLEYFCAAISKCGHEIRVSVNEIRPDSINILPDGYYTRELVDALVAEKTRRNIRMGLMATELYADGGIPYAHDGLVVASRDGPAAVEALRKRMEALYYLVPKLDFVWCLVERSVDEFRRYCSNTHYFPRGHTHSVPAALRRYAKDIDVIFFGKATAHRRMLVEQIEKAGCGVAAFGADFPRGHLPDHLLGPMLGRAKIGLNLTFTHKVALDIDPRFLSVVRVARMLERDLCVVSEAIPLDNPYEPYMVNAPAEAIAQTCQRLLESGEWRELGPKHAAAFRREMDAEQVCGPAIEATLAAIGAWSLLAPVDLSSNDTRR
jgi:hypothetical protein